MPAPVKKNTYREYYKAVVESGYPPPGPKPPTGLGDIVAKVAKPIARLLRLNPECPACQKRQSWLNRWSPFK